MKNYLLLILFIVLVTNTKMYAQMDVVSVKELLNKTEISIYQSQKHMIADPATKDPETLSLAVQYQVLAVEAIASNDLKQAIYYSLKGREYSNATLIKMKLNGIEHYLISSSEKQLAEKYQDETNKGKDETTTFLKKIDESVLFDPINLGKTYKISINAN